MDKKFNIIMIIMWSVIAIFLTNLLVLGVIRSKDKNTFGIFIRKGVFAEVQKEEEISLDNCNKINLDFPNDDIFISSTDGDKLRVIQRATGKLAEEEKFTISKEGNTVVIRKRNPHFVFKFDIFQHFDDQIEVFIPKSYNKDLDIKMSSGNIVISNNITLNNIICLQSSGDLECRNSITANRITLKTNSGNINVSDLSVKSYEINTSSGNIEINSLSGSGDVEASSGNIKIGYSDIGEYSKVSAHSGNIKLVVPKEISFEFDGKCSSGDIDSNFDMNYKNKNGNEVSAKVGSGPYKRISSKTTSGDINIIQK